MPELLDHNTKEWQDLANDVYDELDAVYSNSELSRWYKKIRIEAFSEGSILVDYFVELTDIGDEVDTREIKQLFHEALQGQLPSVNSSNLSLAEEADSDWDDGSDVTPAAATDRKSAFKKLGNFILDPTYTDFIVVPPQIIPTVGYADDDVFLPQWAIAGIVIGLASLLFVIIFGVTVLVNRHKNSKKQPTPLTEDMLNELNKNHMGGLENYGADDLYNMEDVWNDRSYDKPPKKRSSGSIQENSMSNLYDSWRSEWNGYYYNAYYGNNGSTHSGYSRRRSDYDTNF